MESNNPYPESASQFGNPAGERNGTDPRRSTENGHQDNGHSDFEGELKRALSPSHLESLLQGSSILPEVVRARGYRTVEKKSELKRRGFSDAQCNTPGLLLPIFSPSGEIATYQFRPDEQRIGQDGKPVKYETPGGSRTALDVHPSMEEKLRDPSVPLFITEGVKKGDSLVSRDLCTVTLPGAWNWRGTNEKGGKTALPEWEYVALNDRQVYVVFDSDIVLKMEVYQAMLRLKGFLESRGAKVEVIYLPPGNGAKKWGVDDFFAAGHGVEDLLSRATTELKEPSQEDEDGEEPTVPYRATPHGLLWDKPTRDGTTPTPLTNFTAKITADVIEDDGAEERRRFEIEAHLNGRRSVFDTPSERFAGMNWATENLGAGAILYPGFGLKDHARAAVQMLSGEVPTRRAYAHTGWRKLDDGWAYLHAGGAIGSAGPIAGVEVSLGGGRLGDYLLPAPPVGDELKRAVETALRFLELAPLTITVPILGAVVRAPLSEMVCVDFSMHLVGHTGVLKTEISAVAQGYYGAAFNGRNLPGNWESTENALEKQAFITKDALFIVDDFAPSGTAADIARLHRKADRVLRAQGNRSGRARMRADTTLRTTYHPRCLVLSSGEDVPRGQSLKAREMIAEVSPGDVNLAVLTELQHAAAEGLLASATSGYVRWLAPRMEDLKERLPVRQEELRRSALGAGAHARTPDIVASLFLGLEVFLEFALQEGAILAPRAEELRDTAWEALREAAAAQPRHQDAEEPTQQFRELITAAITSGAAHIAKAKDGGEPDDPGRWGWRFVNDDWQPRGSRIGWVNSDEELLLEPGAAFGAAQRIARDQGASLSVGQRALWKRLAEKGLLASRDSRGGRNTSRAIVAGERKIVVHLIAGALSPNDPGEPLSGDEGPSGPKDGAVPAEDDEETARKTGPNGAENRPLGPIGPVGPLSGGGSPAKARQGAPPYSMGGEEHLVDARGGGIERLLHDLRETDTVALDVETTGLDPRRHRVRLLTLATERGAWLIDCFEVDPRPLFPVLAEKQLLIHNALFDLSFLSEMGFEVGEDSEVIDTMLMSQVLEGKVQEVEEDE